jgi:hypothetical protein
MRNLDFQRSLVTGNQGLLWAIVLLMVVVVFVIIVVTVYISEVLLPIRKLNRSSYISFRKYSSGYYLLYNTLFTYDFSALRPLLTDL